MPLFLSNGNGSGVASSSSSSVHHPGGAEEEEDGSDNEDSDSQCAGVSRAHSHSHSHSKSHKRKSVIMQSVVNQLLSGQNPSDIIIDYMPLTIIRSLVARQMHMAVQLLVQLLFQSKVNRYMSCAGAGVGVGVGVGVRGETPGEEEAGQYGMKQCEEQCLKYLLQLYNSRDLAVRREKLTTLSLKSVQRTLPRKLRRRLQGTEAAQGMGQGQRREAEELEVEGGDEETPGEDKRGVFGDHDGVRTRSQYYRSERGADQGLSPCKSIFNVPLLRAYSTPVQLYSALDAYTQRIRAELQQLSDKFQTHVSVSAAGNTPAATAASASTVENKQQALCDILRAHTTEVMGSGGGAGDRAVWDCLFLRPGYPLPGAAVEECTPGSLSAAPLPEEGGSGMAHSMSSMLLFTPSEDELLCKGSACVCGCECGCVQLL